MTPSSGEEETSQRAQEEMRAAAHAADSILEGLETEDTKFITFNALSSIFNILNGLYTALGSLSERWWHLGGQAKQSSAQQELVSGKLNTWSLLPSLDRGKRRSRGGKQCEMRGQEARTEKHEKQRCWCRQGGGSLVLTQSR